MGSYCALRFPKDNKYDLVKMRSYLNNYWDSFSLEPAEVSNELIIHELSLSESLGIINKFKKKFGIPYYYVVHGVL